MAVEKMRRCGFRKVGGLYLVADSIPAHCGLFPFPLTRCPCCNSGFSQGLGFQWTTAGDLLSLADDCDMAATACSTCPHRSGLLSEAAVRNDRAGLLWVGRRFYPTAGDFLLESLDQGISKRISKVPRGFEIGKNWIFLAHPAGMKGADGEDIPAVFAAFIPKRIEIIITESQSRDELFMSRVAARKLTPVIVPDDDRDHRGSVYEKTEPTKQKELHLV